MLLVFHCIPMNKTCSRLPQLIYLLNISKNSTWNQCPPTTLFHFAVKSRQYWFRIMCDSWYKIIYCMLTPLTMEINHELIFASATTACYYVNMTMSTSMKSTTTNIGIRLLIWRMYSTWLVLCFVIPIRNSIGAVAYQKCISHSGICQ